MYLRVNNGYLEGCSEDETRCEIIENMYLGLCPWFLSQSSRNPCTFLQYKITRSIFSSNSWSLASVPDTGLLKRL